jgi:ABC-2 type transport system permease protein
MIGQTLAISWKELQVLLKDKGNLAVLFLMPLLLALVMGGPSTFSDTTSQTAGEEPDFRLDVYLVNLDSGPYGTEVSKALSTISVLRISNMDSWPDADRLVAEGEKPAAIVIPADFTQQIDAGQPVSVQVIGDPTQEEAVGIVVGVVEKAAAELDLAAEIRYGIHQAMSGVLEGAPPELQQASEAQTMGVIWTQVQEMRQNPVIAVRSESLKKAETGRTPSSMDWHIMGFTVMFAFFLLPFMGQSILREKEQGSLRRLLAAPLPRAAIIAGLILTYMIVIFLQVLFMFGVGRLAFDILLGPSLLGLFLITFFTALASASLGLLIGAVAKSTAQAFNLGMILAFGLSLFGGFPVPWFRIGGPMATVANFVPHAHSLQAYAGLMTDGLTLGQVSPHILALLGFAVVFFVVAVWRFRFVE